MTKNSRRLLVTIRGTGHLRPLYLVHSLAGELTWLPVLARQLDAQRPIHGFAAPGLNAKGPLFTSLEEMASNYLAAVRKNQPHGPYLFGGYSFGGVIAYEMARQAQQAGESVQKLILIDAYTPNSSIMGVLKQWSEQGVLVQSLGNLLGIEWKANRLLEPGDLPANDTRQQIDMTTRHLMDQCNIPHTYEALSSMLEKCRLVMQAHTQMLAQYQPKTSQIKIPSLLIHNSRGFLGVDNQLQLPNAPELMNNHDHGWQHYLPEPPHCVAIDTEHFLMVRQPALNQLAEVINEHLNHHP